MSAISHKKSKKDFDILEDQNVQIKEDKNLHHVKLHRIHDLSEVKEKPTEILAEEKNKEPQVSPFAKLTDFVKEEKKSDDGFLSAMRELLHYIKGVGDKKKTKILEFDLSIYESSEDYEKVSETLTNAVKKGVITKEEEAQALSFISSYKSRVENNAPELNISAKQIIPTISDELQDYVGIETVKDHSRNSLPQVREEYITEYVKWEEKSRHGKKMFSKTIGELGGSRPLPSRLTKKHDELDISEKEYFALLKKVSSGMNSEEKMEFLINERISLNDEINSRRGEKERKIVSQSLKGWENGDFSKKAGVSSAILLGHIDNISLSSFSPVGYEGYRAPRTNAVSEKSRSETEDISQKLAKFIEKQNEKKQNLGQIVPEANILVLESEEKTKNKKGLFSGFKKALGLDNDKPKEEIVVEENKNPAPIIEVPEQNKAISEPAHPLSHRIPFHNGFIDIVDTGVAKKVLLNNIEVASDAPLEGGNVICLYDKYQDGEEFADIREAFNIAFDNTFALENKAEVIEEISFENGKIAILFGLPESKDSINILLNGKVIAMGKMGSKGPDVNLIEGEGMKSGWLMADTVYERALKKSIPVLKTLKKS